MTCWFWISTKTVQRACSRYGQASTEHKVSLINLDEAYTRCAEECAQNTIDDIEKHTLECRSAEAWKAINLFCGRKFRFTNCVNAESIDYMKLIIKNHYAAVLNQAPSDNLVKVFYDSSPLTINMTTHSQFNSMQRRFVRILGFG